MSSFLIINNSTNDCAARFRQAGERPCQYEYRRDYNSCHLGLDYHCCKHHATLRNLREFMEDIDQAGEVEDFSFTMLLYDVFHFCHAQTTIDHVGVDSRELGNPMWLHLNFCKSKCRVDPGVDDI